MPQVYVSLPAEDLEAVDCLAEREFDGNRSQVLREAVAEYLHGHAESAAAQDDDEGGAPEPDWRFEWELAGRTRGDKGGDYVLRHKSIEGRYRIIHEEDW